MEEAVRHLCSHKAVGHTHLCVEHFKQWQREAYPGDKPKTLSQRERWLCLVDIVQPMWSTGDILQDLGWTVLVLIPTGTTDTGGIRLLETLWKVVEALIDTRLRASLQMYNVLNGFSARRGTGTSIMELKLA